MSVARHSAYVVHAHTHTKNVNITISPLLLVDCALPCILYLPISWNR